MFSFILELAASEGNYGVMSSFRPANNAKLYATPEEMKNVVYRTPNSQTNNTNNQQQQPQQQQQQPRGQLRKSLSLRAGGANVSFKDQDQQLSNGVGQQTPAGDQQQQSQNNCNNNGGIVNGNNNVINNNNQYAQPQVSLKSRSLSVGGAPRESRKKKGTAISNFKGTTTIQINGQATGISGSAPPIPDPDYSLSESDPEEGDLTDEGNKTNNRDNKLIDQVKETSGNSNVSVGSGSSSSSSSGSGSLPHSFTVEEIQTVRKQLKVFDFLKKIV